MEPESDVNLMFVSDIDSETKTLDDVDTEGEEEAECKDGEPEEHEDRLTRVRTKFDQKFKSIQSCQPEELAMLKFLHKDDKEYWADEDIGISDFGAEIVQWERQIKDETKAKVRVSVFVGGLVHIYSKHCMPLQHYFDYKRKNINSPYIILSKSGTSIFHRKVSSDACVLVKLLDHIAQLIVFNLSKKPTFMRRWSGAGMPSNSFVTISKNGFQHENVYTLDGTEFFIACLTKVGDDDDGYFYEAKFVEPGFKSIYGCSPACVGYSAVGVYTGNQIVCDKMRIKLRFLEYDGNEDIYKFFVVSCYPDFQRYVLKTLTLGGFPDTETVGDFRRDIQVVKDVLDQNHKSSNPWTVDFHVKLAISLLNCGHVKDFRVPVSQSPENIDGVKGNHFTYRGSYEFTVKGVKPTSGMVPGSPYFHLWSVDSVHRKITPGIILRRFPFFSRYVSSDLVDGAEEWYPEFTFCDSLSYFCVHTGYAMCRKKTCLVCSEDNCEDCEKIK